MYYLMIICCLTESGPPSNDNDSDNYGDDINLETPKLNEVLNAINVCRHYISTESCSEKALHSLISLQKDVYALNKRKVKRKNQLM